MHSRYTPGLILGKVQIIYVHSDKSPVNLNTPIQTTSTSKTTGKHPEGVQPTYSYSLMQVWWLTDSKMDRRAGKRRIKRHLSASKTAIILVLPQPYLKSM